MRVRDIAMHSVVLLVKGDGGGPFQVKKSPPSQVGEAALVVWFAVGPIRVKADYPGVGSKEDVLGVASTLGDPLRFRLDGVSFVEEPVEAPIGEVTELQVGQIVLGIQTRRLPSSQCITCSSYKSRCTGNPRNVNFQPENRITIALPGIIPRLHFVIISFHS